MLDNFSKLYPIAVGAIIAIGSVSVARYEIDSLNTKFKKVDTYQSKQYGWIKDLQASDKSQNEALIRADRDLDRFNNSLDRNTEAVNKLATAVAVLTEKVNN